MLIDTSDLLQDTHIEKVIFKYPDMRLLSKHFNISLGERNFKEIQFFRANGVYVSPAGLSFACPCAGLSMETGLQHRETWDQSEDSV